MKFFFIVALGLASLPAASAAPACFAQSLASYEALTNGCMIGVNTFASFTTDSGLNGGLPIDPSLISVTPSGGTTNPGLAFSLVQTAGPTIVREAIFTYTISGATYLSDVITLSGSSESGNGAVTDTQNYCAGGHFGPDAVTGCTGSSTGALVTLDGVMNTDSKDPLPKPQLLSITDDFVIDSGGNGSASAGLFTDQFTAMPTAAPVPEPGAFLLAGAGLALVFFRKLLWANR